MTSLRRIALVGLPGSGKSTIAKVLARRLDWDCCDVDAEVEAKVGVDVATLIANDGEPAFRDLELSALESALRRSQPIVIACGGGLIAQEQARRLLTEETCVVWLDAPDDVLLSRLGGGEQRPLLRDDPADQLRHLRATRRSAYESAHLCVATDAPIGVVVDRVAGALQGTLRVAIPGQPYHVEIRAGGLDDVALHVPAGSARVALIADRAVAGAARRLSASIENAGREVTLLEVSGGEKLKTWASAGRLLARLSSAGIRRHDCVIAVGGGTVGDVTGFVAATHLRGVAWINVPTTLLAMVDSAIGGKTGVNLGPGKNLAGAFWQPRAVISDTELLAELPERSYRSALAEIVKYAMVVENGIASLLDHHLARVLSRDLSVVAELIRGCCAIKGAVVASDERDAGQRAILNYGHTIGHALEAATGYGDAVSHGEAVAVGMRAAGMLSMAQLGCPREDIGWQDSMLRRCGLGTAPSVDIDKVLHHAAADKKMAGDQLRWVLLEARGRPRFGQLVPEVEVRRALVDVLRP